MEPTLGFFLRGAGHEDSAPGSIATELRRSVGCREFLALGQRGSSGSSLFVSKIIGFVSALLKILTRMCTDWGVTGVDISSHPAVPDLLMRGTFSPFKILPPRPLWFASAFLAVLAPQIL